MKNLICFLFCLLTLNLVIGQTSNQDRLEELPALIEKAGANKNYELAAKLQDELTIRSEMQEAIDKEDYKGAAALRAYLYDIQKGVYNGNSSIPEIIENKEYRYRNNKKNTMLYLDVSLFGENDYNLSQVVFNPTNNSSNQVSEIHRMHGLNLKFGHKFYFGSKERDFRFGVDMNYVSLNIGITDTSEDSIMPSVGLSTPSPGFIVTYHINEEMGVDFQANAGFMFMASDENNLSMSGMGFVLLPQLRYWHNKLAYGLQYTYYQAERLDTVGQIRLNHFGLFFGLRF